MDFNVVFVFVFFIAVIAISYLAVFAYFKSVKLTYMSKNMPLKFECLCFSVLQMTFLLVALVLLVDFVVIIRPVT